MLSANANTVQALRSSDRVFTYSVIVNGTTDITDKTLSAQITETGSSAQRLSIGEFCRSQCTLAVLENAIADWYHAWFTVSVTINNESIPLGKYYVPEVDIRNNPGTVTVTGYDSSWLWEDEFIYTNTSTLAIVNAIETYTGQSIVNKSLLTDFTIPIISDSENPLTYRDVMGYIAGLQGYNIRPTRDGNFELYKYFGGTPYTITHADIFESGLSYELTPTEITSYEISNANETFSQGTGYGVVYYNPFITAEIAEDIDDYLNAEYTAADVRFISNPLLQVGDTISVQNNSGSSDTPPAIVGQAIAGQSRVDVVSVDSITVPIMEMDITLDGGLSMEIHAYSEFNSIEYKSPAQRFTAMKAEVNRFSSELVQTQDSITARVSYSDFNASNQLISEQMAQIALTVDAMDASVNQMHSRLDENGLHIYDEGDTITTITGDGLKVNVLDSSGSNPVAGEELLSATSDGVETTRLIARENLTVDGELFNLSIRPFYNDIASLSQIGFFAVITEDNS